VLARLTHTARPVTDSRALCYPWSFRGQLIQVRGPSAVARPRLRNEAPPSLHRVPAARVPRLQRYYGALRFPAVLAVPLRFLRKTVTAPRACVRSGQARRRLGARGVTVRPPPRKPELIETETVGRPKFLGNPPVPRPCSLTPAGPDTPCLDGAPTWPPYASQRRLHARGNFGAEWHGLGTPCLRFARWVTPQDARLGAGCWPGSTRRDSDPQDSDERFP
jgi:hypothetical protein